MRYIDLNPVRAAMDAKPGEYAWSSHRYNAAGDGTDIVTPYPVYQQLGDTAGARGCPSQALSFGARP
jgi:putative transposase